MLEPFEEVGTNFSLQQLLSLWTKFAKIKNRKVITENQCEKHKISCLRNSLAFSYLKGHNLNLRVFTTTLLECKGDNWIKSSKLICKSSICKRLFAFLVKSNYELGIEYLIDFETKVWILRVLDNLYIVDNEPKYIT